MSMTTIPSMIVMDVEPRVILSSMFQGDPIDCEHLWEPHLCEVGRACCSRCGSLARWSKDLECNHLWALPRFGDVKAHCPRCGSVLRWVNGGWS